MSLFDDFQKSIVGNCFFVLETSESDLKKLLLLEMPTDFEIKTNKANSGQKLHSKLQNAPKHAAKKKNKNRILSKGEGCSSIC